MLPDLAFPPVVPTLGPADSESSSVDKQKMNLNYKRIMIFFGFLLVKSHLMWSNGENIGIVALGAKLFRTQVVNLLTRSKPLKKKKNY